MVKTFCKAILCYGTFVIGIIGIDQWLPFSFGTIIPWLMSVAFAFALFCTKSKMNVPIIFRIWVLLIAAWSVWGLTKCDDYWDIKSLVGNIIAYSACLSVVSLNTPRAIYRAFHPWFSYSIFLIIPFLPFIEPDGLSKYFAPYLLLFLFWFKLSGPLRIRLLVLFLMLLLFCLSVRSDILKFFGAFCLGILHYLRTKLPYYKGILTFIWITFLIIPFVFFGLALSGRFNIFSIGENMESYIGEDMSLDTRTIVYAEVLSSMSNHKTIALGETPSGYYESEWAIRNMEYENMSSSHIGERYSTESGILNVFLYFGAFGLIIYFLLFSFASYFAIFKSKNSYLPIIGIFVSFRWVIGWAEDFTRFDLNMLSLWMMIGMCFSPLFRSLDDKQFRLWLKRI